MAAEMKRQRSNARMRRHIRTLKYSQAVSSRSGLE